MTIYSHKTHTEILSLLLTKSVNEHYAKRYIKFIFWCLSKDKSGYTENHHILPKADTCFPEFADLKKFKWNSVDLTPREHFIAHWLLWKSLGKFMAYAFKSMNRKSKYQTERYFKMNSKIYARLREEVANCQSTREITDAARKNMSIGQKGKDKLTCPHCEKVGDILNMKKYHFDNCKVKTGLSTHNIPEFIDKVKCPHCDKIGTKLAMYARHFNNCKYKDLAIVEGV